MAGRIQNETIAAIATPPGVGGIGVIRISGPEAHSILRAVFSPKKHREAFRSHTLYYGIARDRKGTVLDEVLAVYMKAPHTYTREDVVELHSHGSYLVLSAILEEVISLGARAAEPGEFTKRAFLAGRIDLTRAEAVIDLLRARTDTGLQLAVGQLQGRLYRRTEAIRQALLEILAVLEVAIDFPDDAVELIDSQSLLTRLEEQVEDPLEELVAQADQGRIIREGISIVIAGLPNVGKSSLLNSLLQEERALVTPIPGTTRDTIEEVISINGVPARIVDTAGIRSAAGSIEELGIQRALRKVREADLVLFMVDAAAPLTDQDMELYASLGEADRIVVLNKIDIAGPDSIGAKEASFPGVPIVRISARHHQGLADLQHAVYTLIMGDSDALRERDACAPNLRHRLALQQTLAVCRRLRAAVSAGVTVDLLAVEVQGALDCLGGIAGLTTPDDVLDRIFAEFCIGK